MIWFYTKLVLPQELFPPTDYAEEQSSELETLRCIYTEQELTEVSTDPTSFQIKITVNEPTDSEELTGVCVCVLWIVQ